MTDFEIQAQNDLRAQFGLPPVDTEGRQAAVRPPVLTRYTLEQLNGRSIVYVNPAAPLPAYDPLHEVLIDWRLDPLHKGG